MQARLSSGPIEVVGAPPFQRAAVLAAHPLPDPPLLQIRRADGGFDLWPDRNNPDYRAAVREALGRRDRALWEFYCVACLPGVDPPAGDGWLQDLRWLGLEPRPGEPGRKVDWVEYELCQTQDDVDALRCAFREANDVPPEDRAAAEAFFGLTWNGEPLREAAERLKKGKLAFSPGWAQCKAAAACGLLPFQAEEIPPELRPRLGLLYYDLPPRLRARLEVFYELDLLVTALQMDDAWRKDK
jgi:hypothetical protein